MSQAANGLVKYYIFNYICHIWIYSIFKTSPYKTYITDLTKCNNGRRNRLFAIKI